MFTAVQQKEAIMPAPARARIGVRIPEDLLSKLRVLADKDDRSLSYVVVKLLEGAIGKPRKKR